MPARWPQEDDRHLNRDRNARYACERGGREADDPGDENKEKREKAHTPNAVWDGAARRRRLQPAPRALKFANVLLDLETKLPNLDAEGLCFRRHHWDSLSATEQHLLDNSDSLFESSNAVDHVLRRFCDSADADQQPVFCGASSSFAAEQRFERRHDRNGQRHPYGRGENDRADARERDGLRSLTDKRN